MSEKVLVRVVSHLRAFRAGNVERRPFLALEGRHKGNLVVEVLPEEIPFMESQGWLSEPWIKPPTEKPAPSQPESLPTEKPAAEEETPKPPPKRRPGRPPKRAKRK